MLRLEPLGAGGPGEGLADGGPIAVDEQDLEEQAVELPGDAPSEAAECADGAGG